MYTVDIDTGGTMTDALVSDGSSRHAFKVDTTPHDYTVSFVACLQEAAKALNFSDIAAFLKQVRLIRWSSTITTNVLGERRGSKVGVFVSAGQENKLYGDSRSPIVGELVADDAIVGLAADPSAPDVLAGVKRLLETGVRRICVCLENAFPDNAAERAIKEAIEDQYPDHIIGAVPVLLGSEMAPLRHDQTRVHYSVMNAYTHTQLANSLFKAEDLLRDEYGWNGALLIGHTSGGVAKIGKTKAVDTIESGPVFGTFSGAHMANAYGLKNVVCFDVGGTTTKASIVRDGAPVFQRGGKLMEIPVQTSFAMVRSAVVGGGSIAHVQDGSVALGPESMGAAPGPACYGLGGAQATLTDALLVLGYLDPANFLGGRRELNAELARHAIEQNVATPLGVSVDVAALAIRDEAIAMMASLVSETLVEAGLETRNTPIFAFGGNGPMFTTFVAEKLGMPAAYVFDLGPVFSAFGSAISDVVHRYERGVDLKWDGAAVAALAPIVHSMRVQADRDLRGEGFDPEKAEFVWELDFGKSEDNVSTVSVRSHAPEPTAVLGALAQAVAERGHAGEPLLDIRLSTRFAVGSHDLNHAKPNSGVPTQRSRNVRFMAGAREDVTVYSWESLKGGAELRGPMVVNGATLTCPVPAGWGLSVDSYGNGRIQRA